MGRTPSLCHRLTVLGSAPSLRAISAHDRPDSSLKRFRRCGKSVNPGAKPSWAKTASSAAVAAASAAYVHAVSSSGIDLSNAKAISPINGQSCESHRSASTGVSFIHGLSHARQKPKSCFGRSTAASKCRIGVLPYSRARRKTQEICSVFLDCG